MVIYLSRLSDSILTTFPQRVSLARLSRIIRSRYPPGIWQYRFHLGICPHPRLHTLHSSSTQFFFLFDLGIDWHVVACQSFRFNQPSNYSYCFSMSGLYLDRNRQNTVLFVLIMFLHNSIGAGAIGSCCAQYDPASS